MMISVLLCFHQKYVRDILHNLVTSIPDIDVRAIVDSPCSARRHLSTEAVDIVITGSTFIEDLESIVTSPRRQIRPMSVAVCGEMSSSIRERARLSHVDLVIDVSAGLDDAHHSLFAEYSRFVEAREPSRVEAVTSVNDEGIAVHDQIDREITHMIAAGYADLDIAAAVCLSHQTVRNRISRLLGDSGARNRTHLACMYLTRLHDGLLPFRDA